MLRNSERNKLGNDVMDQKTYFMRMNIRMNIRVRNRMNIGLSPFPASLTGVTCAVLGRLDQLVDAGRLDEPVDQVLESGVLSA